MKVGLIGFGAWGRFHARAIAGNDLTELAAIACASETTAEAARAEHPGVEVFTDYRALLARPDIDFADVVLPIHLHAEVGVAALEAGKHVMMEKPMARTVEECDLLIEAARRAGRLLTISHDWRANAVFAEGKRLLAAGEFGAARYVSINLFRNRFREGAGGWRTTPEKVGSWILEEPVHFVDLALWYLEDEGAPVSVWATGNGPRAAEGLYENFTATLRFASGAYATLTLTLGGFEHHHVVELSGTEGALRTWWSAEMDRAADARFECRVRTRDMPFERGVNESRRLDLEAENHQAKIDNQITRVARAFAEGREPTPGPEARLRVLICQEAERSAREGREIRLAA